MAVSHWKNEQPGRASVYQAQCHSSSCIPGESLAFSQQWKFGNNSLGFTKDSSSKQAQLPGEDGRPSKLKGYHTLSTLLLGLLAEMLHALKVASLISTETMRTMRLSGQSLLICGKLW
jgi:hypothetical protein|uniref:Uncharacterized protein n=1 Tax=Mus musculus TaxID=10090 RepID=Q3U5D7_MOUSE|nr:unnamed protein product [Mus musculus]